MAIYRSAGSRAAPAEVPELLGENWVGLSEGFADSSVGQWMGLNVPDEQVVLRMDSFVSLARGAAAGIGLAALPVYFGDSVADLVRASPVIRLQPRPALWILSHRDLKRTARVRAFVELASSALTRERKRLSG
jgi:DNA-binding transcriptional LysR family regulator